MFQDLEFSLGRCRVIYEENGRKKLIEDVIMNFYLRGTEIRDITFWKRKDPDNKKEKFTTDLVLDIQPLAVFHTRVESLYHFHGKETSIFGQPENLTQEEISEMISGKRYPRRFLRGLFDG